MKSVKEWLEESIAYYDVGHFQEALVACDVAIQLAPNLAFAYYCKGRILSKLRDDQQAIAFLSHAIRLEPNVTVAYLELAEILERQGRKREAEQWLDKRHRLGFRQYDNMG